MKPNFNLIIFFLLFLYIASIERYNYSNFNEKTNYSPIPLNEKLYNGSGVCVTVFDLIAFHYTAKLEDISPTGNVFPENFCYGMINYNITREDFRDIIDKNVNAFKNYRSLIPFYIFTNYTQKDLLDDGCIGYFKLISCLNEFPACSDNGDGTFKAHPICSSICTSFERRCTDYYFPQFCQRKSDYEYCPSDHSDKSSFISINLFYLIIFILFFINI
jgi:hypothetical protein